jgi:hypothetical protein
MRTSDRAPFGATFIHPSIDLSPPISKNLGSAGPT